MLGLSCSSRALSSCIEWGLLSSYGVWASQHSGFSCCGAWALGHALTLVIAACRLSSCVTWT